MQGEERKAALPRDVRVNLVIARALVAAEAVLRARINENLDIGSLGANSLDVGERNADILLAEMQLRRHFRLVIGKTNDRAAIIADRGSETRQFGRGHIGHAAAEAEADD